VLGEEFGSTGHGSRRWIIDPIDGTKNFVRGVPVWATLIALVDEGEPVVGVVSAPCSGQALVGCQGHGRLHGPFPRRRHEAQGIQRVQARRRLPVLFQPRRLEGPRQPRQVPGLTEDVWRTRAYGDFWSYCMVAEGSVDIACEPELNLYDMAALVPIVTEAGGRFTSLEGEDGPFGGNALATNSILHSEVLKRLNPQLDDSSFPVKPSALCAEYYDGGRPFRGRPPSFIRQKNPISGLRNNPLNIPNRLFHRPSGCPSLVTGHECQR
jgi:histidinol-phosphatase